MRWLDFSAYDMTLSRVIIKSADGASENRIVVFSGVVPEYHEALTYCGFRANQRNAAIWLRAGDTLDVDRIKTVFPASEIVEVDADEITKIAGGPPKAAPAPVPVADAASTPATAQPEAPPGAPVPDPDAGATRWPSLFGPRDRVAGQNLFWSSLSAAGLNVSGLYGLNEELAERMDFVESRGSVLNFQRIERIPANTREIWRIRNEYSLHEDADGRRYAWYPSHQALRVTGSTVAEGPADRDPSLADELLFMRPRSDVSLRILLEGLIDKQLGSEDRTYPIAEFIRIVGAENDGERAAHIRLLHEEALLDRLSAHVSGDHRRRQDFRAAYEIAAKGSVPGSNPLAARLAMTRIVRSIPQAERHLVLAIGSNAMVRTLDGDARVIPSFRAGQQERLIDSAQVILADLSGPEYAMPLEAPVEIDGYQATTVGEATLLDVMSRQDAATRLVFAWSRPAEGSTDDLWAHIGRRHAVEGRAILGRSMTAVPGRETLLVSVGARRPEILPEAPEPAMRKRHIIDWADLWSWTSEVVISRGKIKKFYEVIGTGSGEAAAVNEFQAINLPMSATTEPFTQIPVNLVHPLRTAFRRFKEQFGDVDQIVVDALRVGGMEVTKETLPEILCAEQVDAVVMASKVREFSGVHGFLNADEMGTGKGRFCATMAYLGASGALDGIENVVLLTERAQNISDLVRDIRDIGALSRMNVAVLNDGVKIFNRDTLEVTTMGLPREAWMEAMEREAFPEGINTIISTYSQFNRPDVKQVKVGRGRKAHFEERRDDSSGARKTAWIKKVVTKKTLLIRDESQNGSQDSQTGATIRQLVEQAGLVIDSSGSYARGPEQINQYPELFPPSMTRRNMAKVLARGGETAQEALAAAMVESGTMVRREHKLGSSEIVPVEPTPDEMEENIAAKDAMAVVLSEIAYMSGMASQRANAANTAMVESYLDADPVLRRQVEAARRENVEVGELLGHIPNIRMRKMGGSLYSVIRLFVAALNARKNISLSVDLLNKGIKPIILVDTTGSSILRDIEEENERAGTPDAPIDPQFRDILRRVVRMSLRGRVVEGEEPQQRNRNQPARRDHAAAEGEQAAQVEGAADGQVAEAEAAVDPVEARRVRARLAALRREARKRGFLATTQDPADMRGYMGAKARRFILADPEIDRIAHEDDRAAFARLVEAGIDVCRNDAITFGYAEAEFLDPLAAELRNEILNRVEAVGCVEAVNEQATLLPVMPEGLGGYLVRIEDMINAIPDLSSAVIDEIISTIEAAGYKMGEITGRSRRIVDGRIVRRSDTDRIESLARFNGLSPEEDRIDGMVINMSGAVGTDMHASSRFPDQRPRALVVCDMPADAVFLLQAYGRVTRVGMTSKGTIILPNTGLACHTHLMSMINTKIKTWAAGVTGNRKSSSSLDVPDMLNVIGDLVATQFLNAHPEYYARLGLEPRGHVVARIENDAIIGEPPQPANIRHYGDHRAEEEAERDRARVARPIPDQNAGQAGDGQRRQAQRHHVAGQLQIVRQAGESEDSRKGLEKMGRLFQRLVMLPHEEEKRVIETLMREYEATVEELNARGENPLRAQTIEGKVHPQSVVPLSGIDDTAAAGRNAFTRPVLIQKILTEYPQSPIRGVALERMVAEARGKAMGAISLRSLDMIEESAMAFYRMRPNLSVEDEIANGNTKLASIRASVDNIRWSVQNLRPGQLVSTLIDSGRVNAISLGVYEDTWRSHSPSGYHVKLVVPGEVEVRRMNLRTMLSDADIAVQDGLNGEAADQALREFDQANESSRMRRGLVLIGNIWQGLVMAQTLKNGHMVSWAGPGGVVQRGILLNRNIRIEDVPTEISSPAAYEYLMTMTNARNRARSDITYFRPVKNGEQRIDKSHVKFNRVTDTEIVRLDINQSVQDHEIDIFQIPDLMIEILRRGTFRTTTGLMAFVSRMDISSSAYEAYRDDFMQMFAAATERTRDWLDYQIRNHTIGTRMADIYGQELRLNGVVSQALAEATHEDLAQILAGEDLRSTTSIEFGIEEFRDVFGLMLSHDIRFYGHGAMRTAIIEDQAVRNGEASKLAARAERGDAPVQQVEDEVADNEDDVAGGAGVARNRLRRPGAPAQRGAAQPEAGPPAQQPAPAPAAVPAAMRFIGDDDDAPAPGQQAA
ncbi:strawberry notch C-terminal domain-containing protein [Acidiphilium sp. C61]|uniref:strawberry notch C-terminal domain-containing protein n=1 Tax=Acidiphilium sp. C61 TaxID=1671485 RepID=UPI00157B8065|nr:strawberry notch C-terminal domain-containing protein [Acidiphilium sp. C61]